MGFFDDNDFDDSQFGDGDDSLSFDDNSLDFGGDSIDFGGDDGDFGVDSNFGADGDFGDSDNNVDSSNQLFDDSTEDSNPLTDGSLFDTGDDGMTSGVPNGGGESGSKKTALIAIAVGVVIIILVFIIASAIMHKNKKDDTPKGSVTHNITDVNTNNSGQSNNNGNANNIMNEGPKRTESGQQQTPQGHQSSSGTSDWTKLDGASGIVFNDGYNDAIFTVTGIEHYALRADPNGNLEVKTELTGSISGYSGTYKLTVPYSKGSKLTTGMTFDIQIQVGDFKGKSVIGDIIF